MPILENQPGHEQAEADLVEKPTKTPDEIARQWLAAIDASQKGGIEDWIKRGERITKRYKQQNDNQQPVGAGAKFNIFWANVDTLRPATYSRRPQVEVFRRFHDADPVGRLAATILQRALQYEVDTGLELHDTMNSVVLDRLLPGRGAVWVRYEAQFDKQTMDVPAAAPDPLNPMATEPQEIETVQSECTKVDYVYWKDFAHSPGRVWADVRWIARRVPFTKDKLEERFGESIAKFGGKIEDVPCTYDPAQPVAEDGATQRSAVDTPEGLKRALVWEIMDKDSKQAIWVAKGVDCPLDIVDDPAELHEFFPCPKPLFATLTNDELVPVADFIIYRDQIRELDTITNRISLLTSALRVIGVFDQSQAALQTLLSSGQENRMVPVSAWAAFAEKGGLKGVMDFVPVDMIMKVLEGLHVAREQVKQTIYELTGMADIIRGASKASETLGAQQIKSKFANLRLSSRQQQVSEFVTRILQIKAEILCNLYSPETILKISSADQIQEAIEHPERVQAAIKLIKDDKLRHYRIEVADSSMLEPDEAQERDRRNDFMSTVSNFMNAIKNVAAIAPEMFPVALEMLKFTVRGFSVGRSLEAAIEDASDAIKKRMAEPKKPEPSDAEIKKGLEMMKQMGETHRLELKEDAATDRSELDAMVKLSLQNLEAKVMSLVQGTKVLDAYMDHEDDLTQPPASDGPLQMPPQQPQMPPQPPMPVGPPQGVM